MAVSKVVSISRQFGSGGAWVGREVAQHLGFQYADRELLADAARALNVETNELAPLEERVCGVWGHIAAMFARGGVDSPFMPPPLPSVSESELFSVQREIIEALAARGNAVIVGRGAAHILSRRPGVIRVFLHAPLASRVTLAMNEYGLTDRESAANIVRTSDAQRAKFVRSLTGHDWCDATLYDLSLNTATTGLQRAVDLIVDLVRRPSDGQLPESLVRSAESHRA
jgi:cytidylate kinase